MQGLGQENDGRFWCGRKFGRMGRGMTMEYNIKSVVNTWKTRTRLLNNQYQLIHPRSQRPCSSMYDRLPVTAADLDGLPMRFWLTRCISPLGILCLLGESDVSAVCWWSFCFGGWGGE